MRSRIYDYFALSKFTILATINKSQYPLFRWLIAAIAAMSLSLSACSDSSSDQLDIAESEIDAGRYASAQSLFDELLSETDADTLSVARLCRMSLLCARLAEHNDAESNLANATDLMQAAMRRDSDSVTIFVESLPIEDRTRSAMVSQLMHAIDHPADSIVEIDIDIDIDHHDE